MNNELCEKLAAHPNFPLGKGLTRDSGHVLVSDGDFDFAVSCPVYDCDEERAYCETVDALRSVSLLLEHPTTIGWMFTDLAERLVPTGRLVAIAQQPGKVWTVHAWEPLDPSKTALLAEAPSIGEALGRAWLASWEDAE